MKRLVLLAAALLWAGDGVAANGLTAAWNNCLGAGGSQGLFFDCTTGQGTYYELFHTFSLSARLPGVVAAQGIVNVRFTDSATVPSWWELRGGCNDGSIDLDYLKGSACVSGTSLLCGSASATCSGTSIAGFEYGTGGPNRARITVALSRPADSPVALTATTHFAWRLVFRMDNPNGLGPCEGCEARGCISFDELDLIDNVGGRTDITSGDVSSDPTVAVNESIPYGICVPDLPVRSKTWGQLKTLYR